MAQDIGTLEQKSEARRNVARAVIGEKIENATNADERAVMAMQHKADQDASIVEFQTSPASSASAAESVEKAIGVTWVDVKDIGTGEVTGRERTRTIEQEASKAAAEASIEVVQNFLKKGYSDRTMPTVAERAIYQDIALETALKIWNETAQVLDGVGQAERRELMDRILKSPLYAQKLKEALETAIEFGKKPPEVSAGMEEKVDAAGFDFEIKKKEHVALKARLESANEEVENYKNTGAEGAEIKRLQDRQAELAGKKSAIASLNDQITDSKEVLRNLAALKTKGGGLTAEQTDEYNDANKLPGELRPEIRRIQKEADEISAETSVLARLTAEKKAAEADVRKLEEEEQKKYLEMKRAEKRYFTFLADKGEAEMDAVRHEESFKSKLKGVPEAAMRGYLEEMAREYEEIRESLIKKNGDAQLSIGLANRWNFKGGPGGKRSGELNKAAIKQDYAELVANGPDEVVIRTLVAGGMARDEAVAKLEGNESFAKKARQDVVERLLSRQLVSGKISPAEATRIVENTEWGGTDLISRALENRLNYVEAPEREALKAAGVLSSEFSEKLKSLPKEKLIKLLLMIIVLGFLSLNVLGSFGLLTAAVGKVGAVAAGAYHGVAGVASGAFSGVTGAVGGVVDSAQNVVSGSTDAAGNVVDSGTDTVTNVASSSAEAATNAASGSADAVTNVVSGSTGAISQGVPPGVINSAVVSGVDLGSNVVSIAADAAPGVVEGVTTGVADHGPTVLDKVTNASAGEIARAAGAGLAAVGIVKYAKSGPKSGH